MRRMLLGLATSVLLSLATSCYSKAKVGPSSETDFSQKMTALQTYGDPDAYAVYRSLFGTESKNKAPVVLRAETERQVVCSDFTTYLHPAIRQAAEDYAKQNTESWLLNPSALQFERKIDLVSRAQLDSMFAQGILAGWKAFDERYTPVRGYSVVSAVGFNADKTAAIVYIANYGGPKYGAGRFVTLSKRHGAWKKDDGSFCSWIS